MAFYLGSRGGLLGFRRLFWWTAAGLLIYGIFLTDSRGTLLALVAVLGVYIWQKRGLVTAGVLALGAWFLASRGHESLVTLEGDWQSWAPASTHMAMKSSAG